MLNETVVLQTPSDNTVPIAALVVSGVVTILVSFLTTYISLKNNNRTVFIQANKDKINEIILQLAEGARRGKLGEIEDTLNSKFNYYIPEDLKKEIKREINKEKSQSLYCKILRGKDKLQNYLMRNNSPTLCDRILRMINKYISP